MQHALQAWTSTQKLAMVLLWVPRVERCLQSMWRRGSEALLRSPLSFPSQSQGQSSSVNLNLNLNLNVNLNVNLKLNLKLNVNPNLNLSLNLMLMLTSLVVRRYPCPPQRWCWGRACRVTVVQ